MRELMNRFPDDLDAATLFAEAGMNVHPWGLWHPDGTPEASHSQTKTIPVPCDNSSKLSPYRTH
jgi:hypothetical protein